MKNRIILLCFVLFSGCASLQSVYKKGADYLIEEEVSCTRVYNVIIASKQNNPLVEKAIINSGCFAIKKRQAPTLLYIVETDVFTTKKSVITVGTTLGFIPLAGAGLILGPLVASATGGYRVTLTLLAWQGVGETTNLKYVSNVNVAIYEATQRALNDLLHNIKVKPLTK